MTLAKKKGLGYKIQFVWLKLASYNYVHHSAIHLP